MSVVPQTGRLGIVGSIIGLIALATAVLPLWVLPAVFPPKPVDQFVVETAQRIKDRVIAKAKGTEYQTPQERDAALVWYQACSIAAVALGLIAIGFAVFSCLRRESWRYAGAAVALGTGAIAFEFVATALAVLIVFAIVVAAIQYLGISL